MIMLVYCVCQLAENKCCIEIIRCICIKEVWRNAVSVGHAYYFFRMLSNCYHTFTRNLS